MIQGALTRARGGKVTVTADGEGQATGVSIEDNVVENHANNGLNRIEKDTQVDNSHGEGGGGNILVEGPESNVVPERPTWRQSETDVTAPLEEQGFRTQVSFKDGEEVPYGTKGSTRPEAYKEGLSIEVKNYNVETSQGRNNLVRNVSNQAQHRAQNLPANTRQQVNIDVRGQNVTRAQLNQMVDRIVEKSNGSLKDEDINILR